MLPRLSALRPLLIAFFVASCQTTDPTLPTFTRGTISFPAAPLKGADDRKIPTIRGTLTKPVGTGPFPVVVLLHSCGGIGGSTSSFHHYWPEYFKELGYASLAVHTYASRGYDRCPNPIHGDPEVFGADAYGALQHLSTLPFVDADQSAIMGFSTGGLALTQFVSWKDKPVSREFRAAINMYGFCGKWSEPLMPSIAIFGEKDANLPRCSNPPPGVKLHIMPGAYHSFDQQGSPRPDTRGNMMEYDGAATQEARRIVAEFLRKQFDQKANHARP